MKKIVCRLGNLIGIRLYINKLGKIIKVRKPSSYGYSINSRDGTWCYNCSVRYYLYTASFWHEGTVDAFVFLNADMLGKDQPNVTCSLCGTVIRRRC